MDEVDELKNTLSEFMDLSDTNYKFMDLKCTFIVYGPKWHELQVDGSKNACLEFVDLNGTPLQVGGPFVHFTLNKKFRKYKLK